MLRIGTLCSAATASVLLVASGFSTAAAYETAPPNGPRCLGLTCAEPGSENDVPEARRPVSWVSGPSQLERQKTAGFYEYGSGTTLPDQRAVAYVAPLGEYEKMPQNVRDLPVIVADEAEGGSFRKGTVVVFGPEAALFDARGATTAKAKRRIRARAAADAYGCSDLYFCLYAGFDWTGDRVQFGTVFKGTGWHALSDYGFNDRADSMRNRRNNDSLLREHYPPSGDSYCADSNSVDSTFSNNAIGDNEASAFNNTAGDGSCG